MSRRDWKSYKQKRIEGPFDVIVIGSGIGGLATAGLLARQARKRVLVLERHYTAGGFTHVFRHGDYEWDVGLHYIGEIGDGTSSKVSDVRALFDYLSDGELTWAPMPEVYDRIYIGQPDGGEKSYDLVAGHENFRAKLKGYFPHEAAGIDRYVDSLFECTRAARGYFMAGALPGIVERVMGERMRAPYLEVAGRTTREVIGGFVKDPELLAVLTGQWGDYGHTPAESSFGMHAAVARHYIAGGYYPVGGSGRIAETFAPGIEARGGEIVVNAEVREILVRGGRAYGVRMRDGKEFTAKTIVSDAGYVNTFTKLIAPEAAKALGVTGLAAGVEPSVGHLCLYVGLKGTARELGLAGTNLWVYPSNDHDGNVRRYLADREAPFPVVYLSFPAAKDPAFEERMPGRATIEIITLAPWSWFAEWGETRWHHRGEAYEALKARFTERLLEALYAKLPQLRGRVDHAELSTPVTTKHFANYQHGELYGLNHTPERFKHPIVPRTAVKGLYLTGQDVCSAGVAGALAGGMMTAGALMLRNPISPAMKFAKRAAT